jgi:hypothetical protein
MKGYGLMRGWIAKSYYQIKGIGYLAWVPVVVLYIILPATNYAVYSYGHSVDELYINILENSQYICPLFSVWYVLFVLYHFIEQPGCDVLYVNRINKLPDLIFPYLFYILLMLPLFFLYGGIFPEIWWLYLKLCIVNLLYLAAVYAASYLFKTIIPAIVLVLLYSVFVFFEGTNETSSLTYFSGQIHRGTNMLIELIPVFVMLAVFFVAGVFANRRFIGR